MNLKFKFKYSHFNLHILHYFLKMCKVVITLDKKLTALTQITRFKQNGFALAIEHQKSCFVPCINMKETQKLEYNIKSYWTPLW